MYLYEQDSATHTHIRRMNFSEAVGPHATPNVHQRLVKRTQQLAQVNLELADEVAKRRQVEIALDQAEEKYRSMFENAMEGMFQITPEGKLISANPALAKIYGYSSVEALKSEGIKVGHLYVEKDGWQEFVEILKQQGRVRGFESQIRRRDGQVIWISETAREVRNSVGILLYYEGMVQDITDRKQAELALKASESSYRQQSEALQQALDQVQLAQSQLVQQEKMSSLGQLVAGVAHEINNPVSFVCGNLTHAIAYTQDLLELVALYQTHYPQPVAEIETAQETMDLEFLVEDLPQVLTSMEVGANRIQQLVRSLRHFSRTDDQTLQPVDLHEGLESTLMILHNRLKAKGNQPEIVVQKNYGDIPQVLGYGGQLNQVFMNLLSNAIDAIEEKLEQEGYGTEDPQIQISTRLCSADSVEICIRDNGMGMTPEIQQKVFNTYFTTKPLGKGTGLGLSLSQQIITERHSGQLRCESQLGEGTTFRIELAVKQG
jgi:PAS domain S-box-containing protein